MDVTGQTARLSQKQSKKVTAVSVPRRDAQATQVAKIGHVRNTQTLQIIGTGGLWGVGLGKTYKSNTWPCQHCHVSVGPRMPR